MKRNISLIVENKNKSNKGYQAKVAIDGKRYYLGTFATVEQAEKAYLDRKRG